MQFYLFSDGHRQTKQRIKDDNDSDRLERTKIELRLF